MGKTDLVVHFAAESHNDNALADPTPFVQTNLIGTFALLEAVRGTKCATTTYPPTRVYGDLELDDPARFTEATAYNPSRPVLGHQSRQRHAGAGVVRSFGSPPPSPTAPTTTGRTSTSKFIPRQITNVLSGVRPRLYGDGRNVRDWIHVDDHNDAVWAIIDRGSIGETYLIGADGEWTIGPSSKPSSTCSDSLGMFDFVTDRPGHDRRYAIDPTRLRTELGWTPQYVDFRSGLAATIDWYRANPGWWASSKVAAGRNAREPSASCDGCVMAVGSPDPS